MISPVKLLTLAVVFHAAHTQADPLARQQNLSRHWEQQQFDLKMQQTLRLPPPILRQPRQEQPLQQRGQEQEKALLDLYEKQRRQLLHQPPPSEQQLQREREAQTLDFKFNNSR